MKKITIAIDGGAGTGKGTTAKGVAAILGYAYIDTGAMYRAATLWLIEQGLIGASEEQLVSKWSQIRISFGSGAQEGQVFLGERIVTDVLRSPEVNEQVARISAFLSLRTYLRAIQSDLANAGGVVMDGRDMGSVVVPHAELKVFLHCSFEERAKRRYTEMRAKGAEISLELVQKNLQERDEQDYTGEKPTSRKATDARDLDTTHLTIPQQIQIVVGRAKEIGEIG